MIFTLGASWEWAIQLSHGWPTLVTWLLMLLGGLTILTSIVARRGVAKSGFEVIRQEEIKKRGKEEGP